MGYELRRHPRGPETRPGWLQWGGKIFAVNMVDISEGGACFVSPRPVSVGRKIRLQIGYGPASDEVEARVVRCTAQLDGHYAVAVQFSVKSSLARRTA
jgi:hypothetical protein